MLDTIRRYETPEGIDLQFKVAGPIVRCTAYVIDILIRGAIYMVLSIVLMLFGHFGMGIFFICVFLLEWFYPVFFEISKGATPGKKNMGLVVIHDNGTPVSWQASLMRNLLRNIDLLPFGYALGLVCMLINKDFKRLGDLAAGTLVVYKEDRFDAKPLPAAPAKPLPHALSITEQRALIDFAERNAQLSENRSQELAAILQHLSGKTGSAGVTELYSYAQWLRQG